MCCSLYTITKNYLPKPYSKKARLFISLVNSLLLSGLAFYTTLYKYKSIDTLIKYESQQTWLADYTIGYFAADLFLGHLFDNTKFNFLTGYVHHITYIAMIILVTKIPLIAATMSRVALLEDISFPPTSSLPNSKNVPREKTKSVML
jgi:hypothetical protein